MSEISIKIENAIKEFRIYHENRDTAFEGLLGLFSKKKHYETIRILDNVSFEINKGEAFGIIGKNGMGKTTLLRLIAGIYQLDSGNINVNGKVIPFLGLGAGFQVEMTAKDNIILYGKLLGLSSKYIKSKLTDIIEYAELEKFADTKLKNFSTGMMVRLAFATSIQVNPDIILADEILSVGDIEFKKKSFETFNSFKKQNKTIVLVSHDLGEIQRFCDRVLFLHEGKIIKIGKTQEVIESYERFFEDKSKLNNDE